MKSRPSARARSSLMTTSSTASPMPTAGRSSSISRCNKDGLALGYSHHVSQAETFTEFTWIGNTNYWATTKVNLIFDGDKSTMASFDMQPNGEPQTFAINPPAPGEGGHAANCRLAARGGQSKPLIGIDNIYLKVARPPEFYQNVRPMLNVGGMMEYPRGKGGIVLCNLLFKDTEEVPANAEETRHFLDASAESQSPVLRRQQRDRRRQSRLYARSISANKPTSIAPSADGSGTRNSPSPTSHRPADLGRGSVRHL